MIKKIFIIFISLCLSLVFISCSDDDNDNPIGPEGNQAKELSLKEIQPPAAMQQSTNPHAQAAVMWLNLANSFKSYSAFYTPQIILINCLSQMMNGPAHGWLTLSK